jgi:hypothetical protein
MEETKIDVDYLSNLSPDLVMLHMTYLPFKDVEALCQANKRLYNICTTEPYHHRWKVLIQNTYGWLDNYEELVKGQTFDYRLYTQLIKMLPPSVQLKIYRHQEDLNGFNKVLKEQHNAISDAIENMFYLAEKLRPQLNGGPMEGPEVLRVNLTDVQNYLRNITKIINKTYEDILTWKERRNVLIAIRTDLAQVLQDQAFDWRISLPSLVELLPETVTRL